MKLPIRYFSIGLLTASIIILVFYLITDETVQDIDTLSVEELSGALESKGFRVINEDDFISYSLYLDEQNAKKLEEEEKQKEIEKKNNKEEDIDKEKDTDKEEDNKKEDADKADKDEEEKEEETKTVTISVEQGFVSKDIAKALKDKKIIDDEAEFVKYMEDNGYSPYIQIGKFKVTSDMNLKKLAETFTTYPGN